MLVLHPLHEHFAAELCGLDISRPLDAAHFREVQEAWSRRAVLVIRGQAISDEQQLAFAKQFGALEAFPPPADGRRGGPELLRISNVRADGAFLSPTDTTMKYVSMARAWHKDTTYNRVPSFGTVLRGVQIPVAGGETHFVDLRAAFERLPRSEQERLARFAALHSYEHAARERGIATATPHAPIAAVHPLVAWHDDGRRSLFLSPLYMEKIEGMDGDAGAALIAELVQCSTAPALIYRHQWRENDIVLWDNRTTMHRVMPYADQSAARTMHRTVIGGAGYVEHLFVQRETLSA
jgi:alpha-ketoglutarate-dependent taurine dioxygenase